MTTAECKAEINHQPNNLKASCENKEQSSYFQAIIVMIIIKFLLLFNREALGQVFSRKENLSQEGEGRMKNERFVEHLDYLNTASLSRVMICNAAKKQFWGKKR